MHVYWVLQSLATYNPDIEKDTTYAILEIKNKNADPNLIY